MQNNLTELRNNVEQYHAKLINGTETPDNILWDLCMLFNGKQNILNQEWQNFVSTTLALNADIEINAPHQASREQLTNLFQEMPV